MCLYVDYDDESTLLSHGTRRARKAHQCCECRREIEPGETYEFWTGVNYGDFVTQKACSHCMATIELGCALTGCPRQWWWEFIHDHVDEMGFVANCLDDPGHHLTGPQRALVLRRVVQFKRKWRRPNGELYPLPVIPQMAVA